ncbi:hypothetical protein LAY57_17045 [Argonema antarcticum A004/B2]|nr:hypothetical protein [Argonema antarcticum A004/B2]
MSDRISETKCDLPTAGYAIAFYLKYQKAIAYGTLRERCGIWNNSNPRL